MIGVLGCNDTKYKSYKEELRNDYGKGHNDYPNDLASMKKQLETRRWDANPNTTGKKKLSAQALKEKESNIALGAVPSANFYQKSNKEKRCYCCGSKNHLLPECNKKGDTPKDKWFQVTGVN